MSAKNAKRLRYLEGRADTLEGRIGMLEAGYACLEDRRAEDNRRAALAARLRERAARRQVERWMNVALAAILTALIVCVLAVLAVRTPREEPVERDPEPAAVVCRWIGADL